MRCPTCGKKVPAGQPTCSFCGAMASDLRAAPAPAAHPPSSQPEPAPGRGEVFGEAESTEAQETRTGEEELEEAEPLPPVPKPCAEPPGAPARPGLARLLMP